MNLYPLVFSFRDLIGGNGFVAAVAIDGRVLLSEEDDGFWMYGVQPGSLSGGGADRESAFKEFKHGYMSVLFDMAAESTTYAAFESKVKQLFTQVNAPNATDWVSAVAKARVKSLTLSNLATVPAESKPPVLTIFKMAPELASSGVNEFDVVAMAEGPVLLDCAA